MIAKGNLHGAGGRLSRYLVTGKKGERAELAELRGFASTDIRTAFLDVEIQAQGTRAEKPFFHAYVRLPAGESLDLAQWRYVAGRIEKHLGFAGQPRAIAFHHLPAGETHMHIAWSRIDLEDMRAIDPGLYKFKLKEISRALEDELGLARVRNKRDPADRTLAPGRKEFEQARRLGTDLKTIRNMMRECWERSDSGKSFVAALDARGLILARGDRRDFVVVDRAGGDHALSKRITGATAAETRARLADVDRRQLPSVDQAKTMQREYDRLMPGSSDRLEILPMPKRGIAEYQPSRINAPALTATRPIVASEPKSTASPENHLPASMHAAAAPAAVQTRERSPATNSPGEERAASMARGGDARPAGDDDHDQRRTIANDERSGVAPPRAENSGTLRRLFRQAVKALTRREADAPKPKKSGRRRDDTGRQFIRMANRLTHLRVRAAAALPWLADTLDWLNLWQPGDTELTDDPSQSAANNHLSPRL